MALERVLVSSNFVTGAAAFLSHTFVVTLQYVHGDFTEDYGKLSCMPSLMSTNKFCQTQLPRTATGKN